MSLGRSSDQMKLPDEVTLFCEATLPERSIYRTLHEEGPRMFPDTMFEDLFSRRGRRSVPPSVVAIVMVLQRLEGLSDREAVDRFAFDSRWRYAAGVGGYGQTKWGTFVHTVLVDMRARLAKSEDPRRIFKATIEVASEAGLIGAKRVLDSTPLYDAVATMDTITLIRSAIRSLLRVSDQKLESELRGVLTSGDDYSSNSKPHIDWDDADGRTNLIDSRAKDGYACLMLLDDRVLGTEVREAAALLATVLGQDLEESEGGIFRIVRGTAKDRVISTVDPEARHGHKSSKHGFDGYKGHVAVDPDSEIITQTAVSAGNAGDGSVAADLIEDLVGPAAQSDVDSPDNDTGPDSEASQMAAEGAKVYGDSAYGTGEFLEHLDSHGIGSGCKTQPASNRGGLFPKSRFEIDLDAQTVTCPADITVPISPRAMGMGMAEFAHRCQDCPLRAECTTSSSGRRIRIGPHERVLAKARRQQHDPDWRADYRATRPKVERKIAHMMRRRHGGRRARVRGRTKIDADFNLLAAACNLARLALLGIQQASSGWIVCAA